jgi:hypothetical protein
MNKRNNINRQIRNYLNVLGFIFDDIEDAYNYNGLCVKIKYSSIYMYKNDQQIMDCDVKNFEMFCEELDKALCQYLKVKPFNVGFKQEANTLNVLVSEKPIENTNAVTIKINIKKLYDMGDMLLKNYNTKHKTNCTELKWSYQ